MCESAAMAKAHPALDKLTTLGSLLGIKSAPVVARVTPLVGQWTGTLFATIPHRFNSITVTARMARDAARTLCGPWLDALAGDELRLELGAAGVIAHSDEAALPPNAPELVHALGDDVVSVGWDGESWRYAIAQPNPDDAAVDATIARFDAVAAALGVTEAQRKIGARLHRALARGMPSRVWLAGKPGELDPVVGLAWDRVEWVPIESMMTGFYPELDSATKVGRIARNTGIEHATVDLVLGPVDPPGMRLHLELA
jgi:hypothetical protein